ncbi:MAG: SLBB domain-containing protein [Candidatus Neomarinimicrobiota bacterium]
MKRIYNILLIAIWVHGLSKSQNLDLNTLRLAQRQAFKASKTNSSILNKDKRQERFVTDRIVDPDEYIVGPGDELHINIISSNETFDHSLVISPTGQLLIPSVGMVNCNKLKLSQLVKEIKKEIRSWNTNVRINVELINIREFRVLVLGQFDNAGYFIVTPMTKVSDLFNQIKTEFSQKAKEALKVNRESSFSETFGMRSRIAVDDFYNRKLGLEEEPDNDLSHLSKRNIQIFREKDTIEVDLEKFKVNGNQDLNPYVQQEDVITIPYAKRFFTVHGGVQKPGKYEYKSGDKILDAITIAGGFHPDAVVDSISLIRTNLPNDTKSIYFNQKQCELEFLEPEDHLMVPYSYNEDPHEIVEIVGEIQYPGTYPIKIGTTTISDIIRLAGGFLPSADSSKIYINNKTIVKIPDRELERILLKDEINRSIEEKAYVKARIRTEKGALETSLNTIKNNNYLVTSNDVIFIQRYFPYVEVIGAVESPGRYPFSSANNANDYIKLAGGVTKNASRKRFVIKSTTGQRLKVSRNLDLQYGDVVFIPERVDYNEWYAAKELVSALYQTGLLVYYIQTIRENAK